MTYLLTQTGAIVRASDGASIPPDERNADYREFLRWKAEGNEPEVQQPEPPTVMQQIAALEARQTPRLLREAALGQPYATGRLAEIDAEIFKLRAEL